MLPVSRKVERWDWIDPFMPQNERRKRWQEDLESSQMGAVSSSAAEAEQDAVTKKRAQDQYKEAVAALNSVGFAEYLNAYKRAVGIMRP